MRMLRTGRWITAIALLLLAAFLPVYRRDARDFAKVV